MQQHDDVNGLNLATTVFTLLARAVLQVTTSSIDSVLRAAHRESLITHELSSRPRRTADYEAEASVLRRLAHALATSDSAMLDTLACEASRVCCAGSAGISVLESPPDSPARFRWAALAGHCAPLLNTYRPFDDSLCGVALTLGKPELFKTPQRYFSSIESVSPPVLEALLVPIPVGDGPWGAIWVMSHDENCRFDGEDLRLLSSLADFTGAAMNVSRMQMLAEKRAREAEQAHAALCEAEERVYEFIATLGHELRSPIAPVISSMEILRRIGDDEGLREKALDIAERQMSRLQRLVDDLLDVSRMKHAKVEVKLERCSLNEVVNDAVSSVQGSVEARHQDLQVTAPSEPITIVADPVRLTQVLVNLLTNSVKYSPDGSRIELSVLVNPNGGSNPSRGSVLFAVSDNGVGIPSDKLPYVCDMFTQLGGRKPSADGGLGIGLALVKYLVECHGGTLSIVSAGEGHGTTVTANLPVLDRSLSAALSLS